ncbi:MAG: Smr/MutS family protein [Rhodospirillales bacterium]
MSRKRLPDQDEIALWRHVMQDVRRRNPEPEAKPDIPVVTAAKQKLPIRPKALEPVIRKPNNDPELVHGVMPGVDRRRNQRLRRGQVDIDGKIDLHGLSQSRAYHALMQFLEESYRGDRRCVLVITGKGLRQTGEIGILRQQVPKWLNDNARQLIQGFNYAHRRHGGEGALYVIMRRKRG